jgi:hypothetical protein
VIGCTDGGEGGGGEVINAYILAGNPKGGDKLGDPGVRERLILK